MLQPIPSQTPPTLEVLHFRNAHGVVVYANVTPLEPEPGSFWAHKDGGIYRVIGLATHTETYDKVVVYEHAWPFGTAMYTRPLRQWTSDRFMKQRQNCLIDYLSLEQHRDHYVALITRRRQERKRQELAADADPGAGYVNQDPDHAPPRKLLASNVHPFADSYSPTGI